MWKIVNGKLQHTTDKSRIVFRTTISKELIAKLTKIADSHNTHINYLLETGFINLLTQEDGISFNKEQRPKDREHYKTTYDKELFEEIKALAKNNDLYINDVIEYSTQFIDVENSKNKNHRYRIEV